MRFRSADLLAPAVAVLLFLLAIWAYLPGLHGGFLFDDFGNLPALGDNGPVDNWPTFFRYITSGTADPTGRPMALLSFLLDAHDWPAAPYPFKRTNLILHLLNAALLLWLLRQLGSYKAEHDTPSQASDLLHFPRAVRLDIRIELAAVLGATFWLLHPLFVSTTLYIVQREAMLPTMFTLFGLLLWLRGRQAVLIGHAIRGLILIVSGLGFCTLLGLLSKANGLLLPALALVIEWLWLTPAAPSSPHQSIPSVAASVDESASRPKRTYRWSMWLLAGLPTAILVAYLLRSGWNGFIHGVSELRPWTMGQRLLTEPRVLMDYLELLWLPRPFTPGLFNDHIKASLSLWSPLSTLPALLAILGLIGGAWRLRRKLPALSLAMFFYFVGQSLESSTVPLELYFEHRNYLPAMLMFWPLALWLCGVTFSKNGLITAHLADAPSGKPHTSGWLKFALAAVILSGLAVMTHARATLWGNTHDQALLWAKLNPSSPRAQANAALLEMAAGRPQQAVARLDVSARNEPDQVQLAFNLIGAHCMLGGLDPADLDRARRAISSTRDPGSLLVHWFESSIATAVAGSCRGLDLDALENLIDAGLNNGRLMKVSGRHQDLLYLKGRIAMTRHDPAIALHDFNAALDQDVRPGAALNQAAQLGAAGYPREGLIHLEHYESVQNRQENPAFGMRWLHAMVLKRQDYWAKEINRLRDTLQQDAKTNAMGRK
ncbi:MAG: tetratricopeptide repeat protein [Rhodanobacter sp.]